jgi:HSP20 family protein
MNPWAEFERIRQGLDVLSQNLLSEGRLARPATVYPPLNIYETKDALIIKAELPGVKAEDLDISLEGDTLTLQGQRKRTEEKRKNLLSPQGDQGGQFQPRPDPADQGRS